MPEKHSVLSEGAARLIIDVAVNANCDTFEVYFSSGYREEVHADSKIFPRSTQWT